MPTGLSYPLEARSGGLVLVKDTIERASQAVASAILTHKHERVMRPQYGIRTYPFDPANLGAITADLRAAIARGLGSDFPTVATDLVARLDSAGLIAVEVTITDGSRQTTRTTTLTA